MSAYTERTKRLGWASLASERGQALAEFMIAFPVLVLLIFGIIKMEAAWRTFQVATNTAREGRGWGLGFSIVIDGSEFSCPMNDGEFWWDGSAGTRFWIDPSEDMITIVMAQVSPSGGGGFREEFKTRVYDAIIEER